MDEYTFIAEDNQAADQIEAAPVTQNVSAEQLYKNELAQETQVTHLHGGNDSCIVMRYHMVFCISCMA